MAYKKKFTKKESKSLEEVIEFLKKRAKVADNNMDVVNKRAFENNMFKIIDVLHK